MTPRFDHFWAMFFLPAWAAMLTSAAYKHMWLWVGIAACFVLLNVARLVRTAPPKEDR